MVRKGKETAQAEGAEPVLTVTAQQSRFHTDASDAPVSKEILVKDLSISIGNKEIISHATLHLQEGRHYVLVGRNGTGKSSVFASPGLRRRDSTRILGQEPPADMIF
jgi:ATP-binding cassette, subfamily F, member 3